MLTTVHVQAGAAAGLTLHEIGSILSRSLVGVDEEPSQLEKMCSAAREATQDLSDGSSSSSSDDSASVSDFITESWEEVDEASKDQDSPTVIFAPADPSCQATRALTSTQSTGCYRFHRSH